jgi:hypothetical protein
MPPASAIFLLLSNPSKGMGSSVNSITCVEGATGHSPHNPQPHVALLFRKARGLAQAVRARDRETRRKDRCTERTATIVTKEKKYLLVHNKLLILALLFLIKNCMHNPISRYFLRFTIKISLMRIEQSQNYNVFDVY